MESNYFSNHSNFINSFVDDSNSDYSNNNEYIEQQDNIIDNNKNKIKETNHIKNKEDADNNKQLNKYNPYDNYLFKKGINEEKFIETKKIYSINIDSSHRRTVPIIDYDNCITLNHNSLVLSENKLNIFLDHNMKINDNIIFSGLKYIKKTLRTFVNVQIVQNGDIRNINKYYIDFVKSLETNKVIFLDLI